MVVASGLTILRCGTRLNRRSDSSPPPRRNPPTPTPGTRAPGTLTPYGCNAACTSSHFDPGPTVTVCVASSYSMDAKAVVDICTPVVDERNWVVACPLPMTFQVGYKNVVVHCERYSQRKVFWICQQFEARRNGQVYFIQRAENGGSMATHRLSNIACCVRLDDARRSLVTRGGPVVTEFVEVLIACDPSSIGDGPFQRNRDTYQDSKQR